MRYFKRWQPAVVCLVALALIVFAPARRGSARAGGYTVIDLGTLGGSQSRAFGVDNCGRVVGDSWPSGSSANHPFFWDGQFTDISTLGGSANALNGSGVAAGTAFTPSGDLHAFIWNDVNNNHISDAGEMKDLGTIPGDARSLAFDINDSGQVVGLSELDLSGSFSDRAYVWDQSAGMNAIPASGGLTPIAAYGINNAGQIVGVATASGGFRAYLLSGGPGGTLVNLGTLGGARSFAYEVNETGSVVGYSDLTGGASFHAFVWQDANNNHISDAGEMKDLGTLTGGSNSLAYDVNATGQVVGYSEATGAPEHAFVYDTQNGMRDLNGLLTSNPGWTLQEARSINDRGQIVGFGLISGQTHAFLLTPDNVTPSPCSTTSITSVSGSGTFNGPATLTATLTSGGSPLSGKTVSFTLNGVPKGSATTNASGVATLSGVSISGIDAGTYPNAVGASFITDGTAAGASNTGALTVSKAPQTITFGTLTDKTFGDASFNVSATGGASGKPVTFSASGNCTSGGPNGSTITITGAGSCTVTASQAGDSNYDAAANVSRSFNINKAGSTTTVSVGNATYDGQPHGGTASVTGAGGLSQSLTVTYAGRNGTNYTASTTPPTNAGDYTASATFGGDANHTASSDSKDFQIAKASTSTALSSSPNPSGAGQSVTFTATVTSSAGTPTGTVQFKDNGASLGPPQPLNANGVATLTTSGLAAGTHTITADYGGDSNFSSSSGSLAGGQVVNTLFEFSQDTYTVAERGGSVTITVKRTGDTSGPMSVDYATDDGSIPTVAVPCSSVTGIALERCDYTRAAGTLRFAAGEAQKTFVVLVNDDSYTEGTETVSLRLSNPAGGAALGPQSAALLQITDDSPESVGNPVDDAQFFVRQHYHDFLNREPDQSGLDFWAGGITSCGADADCVAVKRINTSAAFFLSIEFQETGYLVERIYKTAYGDADGNSTFPSPHTLKVPVVRLNEFLIDTQRIGQNVVVGQGDWQQQLENNKNAFALEFVQRQRFAGAYPATLTADQFVSQLSANAGGMLTDTDKAQLEGLFGGPAASSNNLAARAQALRQVAENPVLNAAEKDRAFVLMQFFGYLRRNPNDAQDTDYTGYDFWLQKLDQFNGDFVRAEMVKAFITSAEYRQRFGQP